MSADVSKAAEQKTVEDLVQEMIDVKNLEKASQGPIGKDHTK